MLVNFSGLAQKSIKNALQKNKIPVKKNKIPVTSLETNQVIEPNQVIRLDLPMTLKSLLPSKKALEKLLGELKHVAVKEIEDLVVGAVGGTVSGVAVVAAGGVAGAVGGVAGTVGGAV